MPHRSEHVRTEPRFLENHTTNAYEGSVVWAWKKSLWITSMTLIAIIGGIATFSLQNLVFFLTVTAIVLCFGHSLGMHRRLIHRSFSCPLWLEYIMVYLGTLVGLGGPVTMMHTHDMRDWAQRKPVCHDYFAHRKSFFKDAFWQMHCDIHLSQGPVFDLEEELKQDAFYQFLEKYTLIQQLPWAILFYALGGFDWVIWGICCRIAISVTGHWLIGYFAHRQGHQEWQVDKASVQGFNIKFFGLMTFGECWHNNHHAFPGSAKLGLSKNQSDPGWWVLQCFKRVGLVWNISLPENLPARAELVQINAAR